MSACCPNYPNCSHIKDARTGAILSVEPPSGALLVALMAKGIAEDRANEIIKVVPDLTVELVNAIHFDHKLRTMHHPAVGPIIQHEFKARGRGTNFTPKKKKRKK